MGTGVRLVSSDGREIIHSFTAENSPLLSNNVNCIAIDDQTGEVCFGTDKGIVCFRGDATAGTETFGNVYAYPNPVKPGYDGPIAITGMANNSAVKITDIAGNLVFETTSEGGQAVWNGKKYDGKRPSTGVYLVFCVNEDASQTVVTKILFIN
jgi:ribosomal protein S11